MNKQARIERARNASRARWAGTTPEERTQATAIARAALMVNPPDWAEMGRRRLNGQGHGSMAAHGSLAKYHAGCRCPECVDRNRRQHRKAKS